MELTESVKSFHNLETENPAPSPPVGWGELRELSDRLRVTEAQLADERNARNLQSEQVCMFVSVCLYLPISL